MSKQAININVNVGYWFQGTGLTGQNLSEHNQNKFTRVATKYKRKTGQKLSKMRCYRASRNAARQIKDEFGTRILSNSITTFEMLLTGIDKTLDRKNHTIDLGAFKIDDIAELACAPTGAAAHRKSA
jgi:hypothetical protein